MPRIRLTRSAGVLLPIALAIALAVAGCSGGGDDPAANDPQRAGSAAPAAAAGSGAAGGAETAADPAQAAAEAKAANSPAVAGESRYVLLELGAWFLSEGVKPIGASRKLYLADDRSFDWYADYSEPDADQSLTLTGRLRGLASETAALKKKAGKVTSLEINGRKAVWADLGGSGEVTVVIELAPAYTVQLTTSGVEIDEALRLARALKPADEAAFLAAGGKVIDCPPGGDACSN